MKRNVGILIFDGAEVLDFAGPFEVFSVTSQLNNFSLFNVFLVHKSRQAVTAVNGLSVNPEFDFSNHPRLDILIISGGQGSQVAMNDDELLRWVSRVSKSAELTMSICSGSRILGRLGLLDHRPFCTHHEVYDHMLQIAPSGLPQKEKRFVASGENMYTSGGITAGIDLSFFVVEKLLGQAVAKKTAMYMEYDRHGED